jgi:hypothetical protein
MALAGPCFVPRLVLNVNSSPPERFFQSKVDCCVRRVCLFQLQAPMILAEPSPNISEPTTAAIAYCLEYLTRRSQANLFDIPKPNIVKNRKNANQQPSAPD